MWLWWSRRVTWHLPCYRHAGQDETAQMFTTTYDHSRDWNFGHCTPSHPRKSTMFLMFDPPPSSAAVTKTAEKLHLTETSSELGKMILLRKDGSPSNILFKFIVKIVTSVTANWDRLFLTGSHRPGSPLSPFHLMTEADLVLRRWTISKVSSSRDYLKRTAANGYKTEIKKYKCFGYVGGKVAGATISLQRSVYISQYIYCRYRLLLTQSPNARWELLLAFRQTETSA